MNFGSQSTDVDSETPRLIVSSGENGSQTSLRQRSEFTNRSFIMHANTRIIEKKIRTGRFCNQLTAITVNNKRTTFEGHV